MNLHINGRDAGLYLESEHPTAEYLERTGRSASSIFTFAFYWSHYFGKTYHHAAFVLPGSRELPPVQGIGQIKQRATYGSDRPLFAKKQLAYALELYRLLTSGSKEEIASRAGSYLALDNFAQLRGDPGLLRLPARDEPQRQPPALPGLHLRKVRADALGHFPASARREARVTGGEPRPAADAPGRVFAVLLEAVPQLRERRDHFLRRLVGDGDRYRAELNRVHARLIRLYPEDERLRSDAESFDAQLLGNLKTLERYFASATPSVHASGAD